MARFPFSRAWARGLDAGALGALRRRLQGDGRRRFHQLTNEPCAREAPERRHRARERRALVFRVRRGRAGRRGPDGVGPRRRNVASSGVGSEPSPSRSLLFRGLAAYERLNETHSTATKVGTSVVILLFGDVAAQKIQHEQHKHTSHDSDVNDEAPSFVLDTRRLVAFASFGAIYTGWFQMHWFRFRRASGPGARGALAVSGRRLTFFRKDVLGPLLINQFGMVPCGYYPFYFAWTGFVRGATVQESLDAARAKYKPHLLAQNWAFWLPAQGVQFAPCPRGTTSCTSPRWGSRGTPSSASPRWTPRTRTQTVTR